MGIGGGLIFAFTLGCGSGSVGMKVGSCTLGSGAGTDVGVSVAVCGKGMGDGLGTGWVVARCITLAICM